MHGCVLQGYETVNNGKSTSTQGAEADSPRAGMREMATTGETFMRGFVTNPAKWRYESTAVLGYMEEFIIEISTRDCEHFALFVISLGKLELKIVHIFTAVCVFWS